MKQIYTTFSIMLLVSLTMMPLVSLALQQEPTIQVDMQLTDVIAENTNQTLANTEEAVLVEGAKDEETIQDLADRKLLLEEELTAINNKLQQQDENTPKVDKDGLEVLFQAPKPESVQPSRRSLLNIVTLGLLGANGIETKKEVIQPLTSTEKIAVAEPVQVSQEEDMHLNTGAEESILLMQESENTPWTWTQFLTIGLLGGSKTPASEVKKEEQVLLGVVVEQIGALVEGNQEPNEELKKVVEQLAIVKEKQELNEKVITPEIEDTKA